MYLKMKSHMECYPSWHIVLKYMPHAFKKEYPNTQLIVDATEFFTEHPSSLAAQSAFSAYKNCNTVKALISITPSGAICFISPTFEGPISDCQLVEQSGILQKLEDGNEVMADKGFDIQDILAPLGVKLNIPPFLSSGKQMSSVDVVNTRKIARLRADIERAIGRVNNYRILLGVIPCSMWDSVYEIVYVACMLANFGRPLFC